MSIPFLKSYVKDRNYIVLQRRRDGIITNNDIDRDVIVKKLLKIVEWVGFVCDFDFVDTDGELQKLYGITNNILWKNKGQLRNQAFLFFLENGHQIFAFSKLTVRLTSFYFTILCWKQVFWKETCFCSSPDLTDISKSLWTYFFFCLKLTRKKCFTFKNFTPTLQYLIVRKKIPWIHFVFICELCFLS